MKHIQSLKSICIEALVKNSFFYAKAVDDTSSISTSLKGKLVEEKTIDDKDKEELKVNKRMAHEEELSVAARRAAMLQAVDTAMIQNMVGVVSRGCGI